MIRVLQVVNDMNPAGLQTMLMNYYRAMDRTQIQFDFLTHRPYKGDYEEEISRLGGKVYRAPRLYPHNYPRYFRFMKEFFQAHREYQIVHSHIDAMSYLPLSAAKRAGVPVRIAHSHNTSIDLDLKLPLKLLFRAQVPRVANYYCACGQAAGEFLFPEKKFTLIYNAIRADRFRFCQETRTRVRRELGITDQLVIGHVGRLSYQKNHKFILKIFVELRRKVPNALLLLVGEGEKEASLRKLVRRLGLEEQVLLLGKRADVDRLYQAMDVFLLPSRFEGIPVVGVEAQFSGLPCLFSDQVPSEVKFSPDCRFLSLKESPTRWADEILSCPVTMEVRNRKQIKSQRYEITQAVGILERYYRSLAESIRPAVLV